MAKKRKSSFRGKVSQDAKRQKTSGSSYGYLKLPKGISVYSPTPGAREKFDIVPYEITDKNHPDLNPDLIEVGDLWYKRPFKVHKNVGADEETYVCLTSFGKKCPICDYRKQRAKEQADKDELKIYYAKDRNLYFVIPRGVKKLEEELHIMDMSWWLFQKQLNDELAENDENEIFPDFEGGLTLKVRWTEETFNKNSYAEAGRIDFIERDTDIEDTIIEGLSLDTCLQELSYDELHAKFFEIDDDEVSTSSKKKKRTDEEDEEEEEEKPTRKRKSMPEPEEDEDEDEEEESLDLTWDDISDMDESELCEVIEARELDIDSEDYDGEDELRAAVAEELDIEKPKRKATKSKAPPEKPKKKGKCPHGHTFGVDTDDFDECDSCDNWDKCLDEKEG